MREALALEARRDLYQHLLRHPGQYLRELQRVFGSMGTLEYHLEQLVAANLVTVVQDGNKRFFPARMDAEDKRRVAFLRQTIPRRILAWLIEHGQQSKAAILAGLDLASSTANYHLQHLVEAGLIEASREGREAVYRVIDGDAVMRLAITYQSSIMDRMIDRLVEGADGMRGP
ncbi:MAG: helix-turn-helix domain-containing protein [Candidatus Thermoplasmatota archaeon]